MALFLKLHWQGHNTKGPFAVFSEIPCCSRHIISQALRSWCEACGATLLNSLCRFAALERQLAIRSIGLAKHRIESSQAEEAISYTKPQARFSVKWGMQHLYRTGRRTKEETSARKSPG